MVKRPDGLTALGYGQRNSQGATDLSVVLLVSYTRAQGITLERSSSPSHVVPDLRRGPGAGIEVVGIYPGASGQVCGGNCGNEWHLFDAGLSPRISHAVFNRLNMAVQGFSVLNLKWGLSPEEGDPMPDPRLSLNQKTTEYWSLEEAVAGCVAAGIGWIGLWREHLRPLGVERAAEAVRKAGLGISSLCRGGFFPADAGTEWRQAVGENLRVIDEALELGTDTVVLVCGGIASGDLDRSRRQVAEGIEAVVPYAAERAIRLAIEPLHPMFCADRSVIVTLGQALDIAEQFPQETVGVVVDTFHVWWDPEVWPQIERAGSRIFAYQVCDWLDPLPDVLMGRGMMGDGVIDFHRFTEAVIAAGYTGPIEVEIFNREVWNTPGDEVLTTMIERFDRLVSPT